MFAGPPYKVVEEVFDEYDLPGCSLTREEAAEPFVDEESIASYLAEARATNDPQVIRKAMALAAVTPTVLAATNGRSEPSLGHSSTARTA